ncbi:MAG: hypothetical protein LIP23_03750 [Planctomycetes bacterium]|nr:hypothetical protein [Planctomycetota bacterium]
MDKNMRALLELNQVDKRIVRGKLRLQELNREIAAQEQVLEQARDRSRKIEEAIKDKAFATDRLNMEIRAAEAEVGEQERKLKAIKNQKEFRIVTDRIKDLKIQVDDNESAVISGMEELDKLREQMNEAHNRIGEEDLKLTSIKETAQEEAKHIRENHAALLEERKAKARAVQDEDILSYQAYDLALKRTKGDPLAEMSLDGICQSCFRRQNSNVLNLVHIGKDIKNCRCQGCGRIMYVKDEAAEEGA